MNVEVDFERYAHFLADNGLSEVQVREKLQEYWNIVCGLVALGWGVSAPDHALQFAEQSTVDGPEDPEKLETHGSSVVKSSDQTNKKKPAARSSFDEVSAGRIEA